MERETENQTQNQANEGKNTGEQVKNGHNSALGPQEIIENEWQNFFGNVYGTQASQMHPHQKREMEMCFKSGMMAMTSNIISAGFKHHPEKAASKIMALRNVLIDFAKDYLMQRRNESMN